METEDRQMKGGSFLYKSKILLGQKSLIRASLDSPHEGESVTLHLRNLSNVRLIFREPKTVSALLELTLSWDRRTTQQAVSVKSDIYGA